MIRTSWLLDRLVYLTHMEIFFFEVEQTKRKEMMRIISSYGTVDSVILMTKSPFSENGERVTELLELVHKDVCGPMTTRARGRYLFITFTSEWFGYMYLMKYKSKSFDEIKEFTSKVDKQTDKSIKVLRLDREWNTSTVSF